MSTVDYFLQLDLNKSYYNSKYSRCSITDVDRNEKSYNEYPEAMHRNWNVLRGAQPGQGANSLNAIPNFLRNDLPINIARLDYAEIYKIAESREDFQNYDYIMGKREDFGTCLCELRIVTGFGCIKHLRKNRYTATEGPQKPGNIHWGWYIDPSPRGFLCPAVLNRNKATGITDNALRDVFELQHCGIAVVPRPPPESWVLAHHPESANDAVPGRAVTDIVSPNQCFKCQGYDMDDNNQLKIDQYWKHEENNATRHVIYRPMQYFPQTLPGHELLTEGNYYHFHQLKQLGIDASDIVVHRWTDEGLLKESTVKQWLDTFNDSEGIQEALASMLNPFYPVME